MDDYNVLRRLHFLAVTHGCDYIHKCPITDRFLCLHLQEDVDKFRVPSCDHCGGIMKPYIVFFGDNVPVERVQRIRQELAASDGLLVLGSSLFVYSGYR